MSDIAELKRQIADLSRRVTALEGGSTALVAAVSGEIMPLVDKRSAEITTALIKRDVMPKVEQLRTSMRFNNTSGAEIVNDYRAALFAEANGGVIERGSVSSQAAIRRRVTDDYKSNYSVKDQLLFKDDD